MSLWVLCFVLYLLYLLQLQETFVQQKYSIAELEIKFAVGTFTMNMKMDAFNCTGTQHLLFVKGYSIFQLLGYWFIFKSDCHLIPVTCVKQIVVSVPKCTYCRLHLTDRYVWVLRRTTLLENWQEILAFFSSYRSYSQIRLEVVQYKCVLCCCQGVCISEDKKKKGSWYSFWYQISFVFSCRIYNKTRSIQIYICIPFFICIIKLSCHLLTCIYSFICCLLHTFSIIVADVFSLRLRCLSLPDFVER